MMDDGAKADPADAPQRDAQAAPAVDMERRPPMFARLADR
jgi:hypothetical protein